MSNFADQVQAWVSAALKERELSFGDVVRMLPGIDPLTVRDLVTRADFSTTYPLRWKHASTISPPGDPRLPVPHPLDFDWRFSSSTISDLKQEIIHRSAGSAILLGAPSLWLALHDDGWRPWLLDADQALANLLLTSDALARLCVCDVVRGPLPPLELQTAFADPPWYPDAMRGFLWAAHALVRLGGEILLSAPPLGTRPGIEAELDALIDWADGIGLVLRSHSPGAIRYSMPPFERNALRAAGLLDYVPHDWRQGDLLVFERRSTTGSARPFSSEATTSWAERVVEGVRIRIDTGAAERGADPRLVTLVEKDVLPSVSRRDARRSLARVWTSGNRIFGCASPSALWRVLDGDAPSGIPSAWVDLARRQVDALVNAERWEYIRSGDA